MNEIEVIRPKAPDKKIRTSDSFELCYIRHQYFRRVKYNPTQEEMEPYMKIVDHFTKNTYYTYHNLFKAVGMEQDDVLNVGRVQLVSFLGLYTLDKMKDKEKSYIVKFYIDNQRDPDQKDFEQKNKANFTFFFKQRMEDLVRVCRQKVRNIKGQPSEEYTVFCGKSRPPKYPNRLVRDHDSLGYKKIDFSVFKSIRKKANVNNDATIFVFDGIWYVAIAVDQRNLEIEDIVSSGSNPYDNGHNMRPDELYEEKEKERFQSIFNQKSDRRKRTTLNNFIAKHKKKSQYRDEVATARKLLKSLGD